MNRSCSLSTSSLRPKNCRNALTPARVKRQALAENLARQWQQLRQHASIEKNPEKLLGLTAEVERRKRQAEWSAKYHGSWKP